MSALVFLFNAALASLFLYLGMELDSSLHYSLAVFNGACALFIAMMVASQ